MAELYEVLFLPDDVRISVPPGGNLMAAAIKAGVFINGLCGGEGVCGRCRVIIRKGKVSGGSVEFFSREEIQRGYILACLAKVESNLVVVVPPETRLVETPKQAEGDVPYLAEVLKMTGRGVRLSPLVEKIYVELPEPDLENNISDQQRLEGALAKSLGRDEFQMGLKVLRRLPHVLRKSGWKATAVIGHRGPLTEIIDVEAGNTSRRNFCIAADIGTTTVVCDLVDLQDGQTLGQAAKYNSQAQFGADVIRRIMYASSDAESENNLREAVVNDLNQLIREVTSSHRLSLGDISMICAAGNTTMVHLLLGLPAENIRKNPYTGAAYRFPPFRAAEIGLKINPRGLLYCLPCVAGFVGADIVAGIFATGMAQSDQVRMLIDIGTNGEIAVGNKDFMVCASASAGPAFEGSECRSGMRATRGAIDHIRLLDASRVLNYSTIGSASPVGICGTGYVDLLAEMLRMGLVDKRGKLNPNAAPGRVREGAHGDLEYVVIPPHFSGGEADIVISQSDINNILRAKGAIYAAASVLLKALNLTFEDLAEILVAGGFGNFLNLGNAVFTGLLPDVPLQRLKFVGNSSLAGAKLAAIGRQCYQEILDIASRTTYFELSTDPSFMEQFVSACFFPHTNVELFPSVLAQFSSGRRL